MLTRKRAREAGIVVQDSQNWTGVTRSKRRRSNLALVRDGRWSSPPGFLLVSVLEFLGCTAISRLLAVSKGLHQDCMVSAGNRSRVLSCLLYGSPRTPTSRCVSHSCLGDSLARCRDCRKHICHQPAACEECRQSGPCGACGALVCADCSELCESQGCRPYCHRCIQQGEAAGGGECQKCEEWHCPTHSSVCALCSVSVVCAACEPSESACRVCDRYLCTSRGCAELYACPDSVPGAHNRTATRARSSAAPAVALAAPPATSCAARWSATLPSAAPAGWKRARAPGARASTVAFAWSSPAQNTRPRVAAGRSSARAVLVCVQSKRVWRHGAHWHLLTRRRTGCPCAGARSASRARGQGEA